MGQQLTSGAAHKLISALVCDAQKNFVAAGVENPEDGPNSSPVYIWYFPMMSSIHQPSGHTKLFPGTSAISQHPYTPT